MLIPRYRVLRKDLNLGGYRWRLRASGRCWDHKCHWTYSDKCVSFAFVSDATEDSASRNAGTQKVIGPAPGASIWPARAASWLLALGLSVALHAAAATWVALPWPNTSTQPLPPIPEQLFASNLDLIVPVEFSLR